MDDIYWKYEDINKLKNPQHIRFDFECDIQYQNCI